MSCHVMSCKERASGVLFYILVFTVFEKEQVGQWTFCLLRPERPITGGRVLGERAATPSPPLRGVEERCKLSSGVRAEPRPLNDFSVLRSPGSLFCYVTKGKQQQKSFNVAARGLRPGG